MNLPISDRYTVKSIDTYECREWFLKKHYAKRVPTVIMFSFGLFNQEKILVGVISYGLPPSRPLCVGVCGIDNANQVLELNRLCVNDNLEKNVLSYFVSKSLNQITGSWIVISFADSSQGHHGYIYQATNWIYTGLSEKKMELYDEKNPNLHPRHLLDKKKNGYPYIKKRERSQKHRYIYFLGSKKDIKKFRSKLKYSIQPYPKGENKTYDSSYQPTIQTKLF
jgi:hypothetical protein